MYAKGVFIIFGLFVLGWVANTAFDSVVAANEQPVSFSVVTGKVVEQPSPKNRVTDDSIHVYNDRIIIYIDNPKWASFTDTNSMDPVLDAEANAIQIQPSSEEDIQVGDIVSYKSGNDIIIHRVVEIGEDELGWYSIVKGDNNPAEDPEKIRFDMITRVLIGIIY